MPISHLKQSRLREGKQQAQGHTASKSPKTDVQLLALSSRHAAAIIVTAAALQVGVLDLRLSATKGRGSPPHLLLGLHAPSQQRPGPRRRHSSLPIKGGRDGAGLQTLHQGNIKTHKDCNKRGAEERARGGSPELLWLLRLQNLRGGREGWSKGVKGRGGREGLLGQSFTSKEANAGSRPQLGLPLSVWTLNKPIHLIYPNISVCKMAITMPAWPGFVRTKL